MFSKENRLTKTKDFDNIFQNKASAFGKYLGVKLTNNKQKKTRFGIIVGVKVSKSAVTRNRIKRQIRSILQNEIDRIDGGYDIVIITLPAIKDLKYKQIEVDLFKQLSRLKVLRPTN